ncbi:MAG: hypothetical protein ACFWT6_00695 [Virgibacillus proomii]
MYLYFGSTSSPIQTVTVGSGLAPDQPQNQLRVTDLKQDTLLTVGREFHPAPKMESIYYCY